MRNFAELLKTLFDNFERLVRLMLPGIVGVMLYEWLIGGRSPFALDTGIENAWQLAVLAAKTLALGVVIYALHMQTLYFLIHRCMFHKRRSTTGRIASEIMQVGRGREIGYPAALGRFIGERFRVGRAVQELSEYLFNRWALVHLTTIVGEVALVLSVAHLLIQACSTEAHFGDGVNLVAGFILAVVAGGFGIWQMVVLLEAEVEIWK